MMLTMLRAVTLLLNEMLDWAEIDNAPPADNVEPTRIPASLLVSVSVPPVRHRPSECSIVMGRDNQITRRTESRDNRSPSDALEPIRFATTG
jgi:hypothetical protein